MIFVQTLSAQIHHPDQLMKQRLVPEMIPGHDVPNDQRVQDFRVDISVFLNFVFV